MGDRITLVIFGSETQIFENSSSSSTRCIIHFFFEKKNKITKVISIFQIFYTNLFIELLKSQHQFCIWKTRVSCSYRERYFDLWKSRRNFSLQSCSNSRVPVKWPTRQVLILIVSYEWAILLYFKQYSLGKLVI